MTAPGSAERQGDEVVDMVDYLRQTIAHMDRVIEQWKRDRNVLATRLAAMEAGTDPAVREAAEDYIARANEGRPYEDAQDAADLLSEAHRRFS